MQEDDRDKIFLLVADLTSPDQREGALLELSKRREAFADLAPILWHSFGTIAALLQEIIAIYPLLNPPSLTAHASNRVCNALALLQCVASHPETRTLFLNGARSRSLAAPPRVASQAGPPFNPPSTRHPSRSAHPTFPLPLFEHGLEDAPV